MRDDMPQQQNTKYGVRGARKPLSAISEDATQNNPGVVQNCCDGQKGFKFNKQYTLYIGGTQAKTCCTKDI